MIRFRQWFRNRFNFEKFSTNSVLNSSLDFIFTSAFKPHWFHAQTSQCKAYCHSTHDFEQGNLRLYNQLEKLNRQVNVLNTGLKVDSPWSFSEGHGTFLSYLSYSSLFKVFDFSESKYISFQKYSISRYQLSSTYYIISIIL